MSVNQENLKNARELLSELGLTEYQSKILAYLIIRGESKAPEISQHASVPSAKVYGV